MSRITSESAAAIQRECASINAADAQDDVMDWLDAVSGWIWSDTA